jgi:hypothetical protein
MFKNGEPDTVVIKESTCSGFGEDFEYTFKPLSITALELERIKE